MVRYLASGSSAPLAGEAMVAVRGYARRPVRMTFRAWLNVTDRAVATLETSLERGVQTEADASESEVRAKRWLQACFEHETRVSDAIARYKARRNLLDLPPDPSRIIRCMRCGIALTDPVSKVLGIGPVCRIGGRGALIIVGRATAAA